MRPPAQPPKVSGRGPSITTSRWAGTGDLDALEHAAHRFVPGIPRAIEAPKWTVEVPPAHGPALSTPGTAGTSHNRPGHGGGVMRFGVHLGPFWASFGGRRRRKQARRPAPHAPTPAEQRAPGRQKREQPAEDLSERRRTAAMTPEESGRHLGMPDDETAQALFKLTAQDRQQADAELQRLRHEMGYRNQD